MVLQELRRIFNKKLIFLLLVLLFCSVFMYIRELNDVKYGTDSMMWFNIQKQEYADSYQSYIDDIIEKANTNLGVSIFAKKGSFTYNNQIKVIEDFSRLKNITVTAADDRVVTSYFSYNYGIFFMIAAMLGVMNSILLRKNDAVSVILFSTVRGRCRLGIIKFVTVFLSAVIIIVFFTIVHLVVGFAYLGGADVLGVPVQSISSLKDCVYTINVFQYILIYASIQSVGLIILAILFGVLFRLFKDYGIAVLATLLIMAVELIFSNLIVQDRFVILKYVNIISLILPAEWFGKYYNYNFFNMAISVENFIVVFLLLFMVLLGVIYIILSGRRMLDSEGIFEKIAIRISRWWQKAISYLPGRLIGGYKILIMNGAALVIAVVVILFIDNSEISVAQYDNVTFIKTELYSLMENKTDEERMELLQAIEDEENALAQELEEALAAYKNGEIDYIQIEALIQRQAALQYKVKAAKEIKEQLGYLEELHEQKGVQGTLINESAYDFFIGEASIDKEAYNILYLYLGVVLIAVLIFAYDKEQGMRDVLVSTVKGKEHFYKIKKMLMLIICIVCIGMEFVLWSLPIEKVYGIAHIEANLWSLSGFSEYPFEISIGGYIAILLLFRLLVLYMISLICMGISIIHNKLAGLAVGIGIIIPHFIYLIGFSRIKNISLVMIMQGAGMNNYKGVIGMLVLIIVLALINLGIEYKARVKWNGRWL